MERLYSVTDICELFRVKDQRTARKIMRDMEHMEKPLLVTERAVKSYIDRKTVPPEAAVKRILNRKGAKHDGR